MALWKAAGRVPGAGVARLTEGVSRRRSPALAQHSCDATGRCAPVLARAVGEELGG